MDIPITVPQLIVLKYLARNNNSVPIGTLKSSLISETDEINSSIELLRKQDYLITNEPLVLLNDKGISFVNEYDNIGSEYIHNGELDDAVIYFLYILRRPISSKWFPLIIQEKAPATSMSKPGDGFNLDDYIQYKSSKNNYILIERNVFSLKSSGREYYESKVAKEKEKLKKESLHYEQLEYSVQELKNKLTDYHDVQKRGKDAILISKVSIGLSILIPLILLILKWQCNVPVGK